MAICDGGWIVELAVWWTSPNPVSLQRSVTISTTPGATMAARLRLLVDGEALEIVVGEWCRRDLHADGTFGGAGSSATLLNQAVTLRLENEAGAGVVGEVTQM